MQTTNFNKTVYICSPCKGDTHRNISWANKYCKIALDKKVIPLAPHVIFTQFLNDDIPNERTIGLRIGLNILSICDEVWVFGEFFSEGMCAEIDLAKTLKIPIIYHNHSGEIQQKTHEN